MNIDNLQKAVKLNKQLESIEDAIRSVENANNLVFHPKNACYVFHTNELEDLNNILLESIKPITLAILKNQEQIILKEVSQL